MNCGDYNDFLDDYLCDRESENGAAFATHVASCERCRSALECHQQYLAVMALAKAPTLDNRRTATMIRLAESQGRLGQQRRRGVFQNAALVASLVAIALIVGWRELPTETLLPPVANVPGEALSGAAYLAAGNVWLKDVTIVINVPQDMENARLVFNLPPDVSLRGQEYLSQIDWPVSLKKGSNTIVLPLNVDTFAEFSESVTLTASLIYKKSKKDFELDIDLAPPQLRSRGGISDSSPRLAQLVKNVGGWYEHNI